ncbi:hypothetical protein B0J14DRAFT_232615 [Halenospora varia]|nr:hypothetical protein B0J14DRAFT_232615 [Halenospora varia]
MSEKTRVIGDASGRGTYNSSHFSTVALSYDAKTLPTPWPVLLASFMISFLLTARGIQSSLKIHNDTITSRIFDHIATGINSVRAVTAFLTALAAIRTNEARFEAPSALAMMALSIVPSLLPSHPWDLPRALVAAVNLFLTFLSMCFMTFGVYNHKLDYYAKWLPAGGNCPVFLNGCWPFNVVGCGFIQYYPSQGSEYEAEPNLSHIQNKLAFAEQIMGSLLMWVIGLVGVGLGFGFVWLILGGFRNVDWSDLWDYLSGGQDPDPSEPDNGFVAIRGIFYIISLIGILIYATITLPLHITQQRQSRTFAVADSFGNVSNDAGWDTYYHQWPALNATYSGDSINGTAWIDCFNVTTPVDYWGFAGEWWEIHKRQIQVILPVV